MSRVKRYGQLSGDTDAEGQEKIKAVKAVVMRWMVDGKSMDEILTMDPRHLTIPEFVAWREFKNAHESSEGTQAGIRAAETLRLIIDGPEDTADSKANLGAIVTLIDRLTAEKQVPTATVTFIEDKPQLTEGKTNGQEHCTED